MPGAATTVSHKRCSKCGQDKSSGSFYKDASSATGLDSCCRECRREYARNRPKRETPSVKEKICSHCSQLKSAVDFGKNARETTGLQPWCRACHSRYVNKKPKVDAPCVTEKLCSKCGLVKKAADFCKDKYKPSGLRSWCRGCRNAARAATRKRRPCAISQKCRSCGGMKRAQMFPKCKENASGLKSVCHECDRARKRQRDTEIHPCRSKARLIGWNECSSRRSRNAWYRAEIGLEGEWCEAEVKIERLGCSGCVLEGVRCEEELVEKCKGKERFVGLEGLYALVRAAEVISAGGQLAKEVGKEAQGLIK